MNSKEGNSLDFCLDFVQEFGLFMRSSAGHFDQRGDIQGTHLPNDASPKGLGYFGLGHIVMASSKAPLSQFKI